MDRKITKTQLSKLIQEELAATNLQEAPLPADEYKETVEYLWTQFLSHIVLPIENSTNLNGEVPPAIKTIRDYWDKKDFEGMASEFLTLKDEVNKWLKSKGIRKNINQRERDANNNYKKWVQADGYLEYSRDGKSDITYRSLFSSNFNGAWRLIQMLIDKPPAQGYGYRGFAGMSKPGVTSARYKQDDNLGRRQTQEGKNKMKITKTHLARIVQEEVASIVEEGMMDAIRSKLSPKRPAKAPYKRSANDAEAMRLMGVEDANDAMHITGAFRESPSSPDDEDYMAGWNDTIQGANSAMQEGKNKIKITKSTLAQIVQEELTAMKAEGYGNYKRDDKKPKRGKKDLGEAEGRYEFELDPKVQQSVLQALANSGTGALDFPLPLTPEQEKYYSHLDDGDRQSMLRDVVEELVELGKIKVADGLYYAVQRLEEDLAPYSGLEEYVIDALTELGGEDALGDIAHVAGRAWAASNWSRGDERSNWSRGRGDERIDEKDMFYSVAEALENLLAAGRVRLTQGGPDSTDEDFYALA